MKAVDNLVIPSGVTKIGGDASYDSNFLNRYKADSAKQTKSGTTYMPSMLSNNSSGRPARNQQISQDLGRPGDSNYNSYKDVSNITNNTQVVSNLGHSSIIKPNDTNP